jgi:hypothetical protein
MFKQPPAASRSSYVSETNMVAKVTDSTINRTPCIAQAKPLEINTLGTSDINYFSVSTAGTVKEANTLYYQ